MSTLNERTESVYLRCDCHAETLEFNKITWSDETDYEVNIVDSYCGGDLMGIANRFKRAWRAFWAKPICHASVYVGDPARARKFLEQCLELMSETEDMPNDR